MLAAFRRSHPGVAVTVDVSDSRRAAQALLAQECDFALVGAQGREPGVVYSAVADDEVVLAGAPRLAPSGRVARRGARRARRSSCARRARARGASVAKLVQRVTSAGSPAPIQVGSTELARRCALEGAGLTFISRRAIAEDLAARRLVVVKLAGTPVHRRFYAARLRQSTLPAAARALLDGIHQKYR